MRRLLVSVITYFGCLFLTPSPTLAQNTVNASFTAPGVVCQNTPVQVKNTSIGVTTSYWSFCAANFSTTPEAVNLGNPGGQLLSPVFGCYQLDDNGNYYGIVTSYDNGNLVRLNFGNSLLNTPTAESLGTFNGALPNQCEGIQLLRVNKNWTAVIVGGGNLVANSSPRIVKLDFGSSLSNTPVATNWGNIGGLNLPHDLYITQEAGNYYGFTINVTDNTFTRFDFGPDFTNAPTGINLGNIGNITYPSGFYFIKNNQNWYAFICDRDINSLTRLDFGTSLLNNPTGTVIGNPGGFLSYSRDISLFAVCDGIYGFVTNETSNELVKLYFGNDLTVAPQAVDLGNIGNLDFPHSISDFFRAGNDIYAFIPNVYSNSLTRIRFAGCQDIPGSNQINPGAVSYPQPGTYNINLLVDVGLPTQTSICKQIVVNPSPDLTFTGDSICQGSNASLKFSATEGSAPFTIGYSDPAGLYSFTTGQNDTSITLINPTVGNTLFTLATVTDANGCTATPDTAATLYVEPVPQGGIAGDNICDGDSVSLIFNTSNGNPLFAVELSDGTNNNILYNVGSAARISVAPIHTSTTYSLVSITNQTGKQCARTSGFTSPSVPITVNPSPKVQFDPLTAICYETQPIVVTQGKELSGLSGAGVYSGAGINAAGYFSPALAGAGNHMLTYTYTATDGCIDSASSNILVNSPPNLHIGPDLGICGSFPVQLSADVGGSSVTYLWSPSLFLDDPAKPNPVATVNDNTTFSVQVTDSNNCTSSDSMTVYVTKKYLLVVPNAFTPNGDGHNDCFGIQHWENVTVEDFSVYNRVGQRVFSAQNSSDCWDGTFKGTPQVAGTYVYVIRVKSPCGETTRTGTVILVR